MKARKASMPERVAENLATIIHGEMNARCREESMSALMLDVDGEITDAQFADGHLLLSVKRPNGKFVLTLKPVSWQRRVDET